VTNSGNSSATGGQGGSATANGGAGGTGGSVSGSGNSTVKNTNNVNTTVAPVITSTNKLSNSGNSSNTNTNTANGGTSNANGNGSNNTTEQQQSSTSSANNTGGNSSNSYSSDTTYDAAHIPVNTAVGTTIVPGNPCYKTYGGGFQGANAGISLGGGKIDGGCDAREYARFYKEMLGSRVAACKMLVTQKRSKKAGVTMADCLNAEATPVVIAPAIPAPAPTVPTIIVIPAQTAAAPVAPPVVVAKTPAIAWTSICTFNSPVVCTNGNKSVADPSRPTSVCKSMIDSAVKAYKQSPGSTFVLVGNRNSDEDGLLPKSRTTRVRKQLEEAGVPTSAITEQVGTGRDRTVEIVLIQAQ